MNAVTLLTDFGTVDGYVGAMKGVLARGVPGVLLHDYGSVAPGEALALVNSDGCIEIAIREGWARERFGWGHGTRVRIQGGSCGEAEVE